jgi:dTDP-4-amino-4,6-dideoxygalactose transaminase
MDIPFNRPYLSGRELKYVREVLENIQNGLPISGDGYYTKKIQSFFEQEFHSKKALLTTSCTSALELATHLLDFKPEDEVIVPSFTFSSTVNPIILAGAKPVFADINDDTFNIEIESIKTQISSKTRAIYPMHYAGVACQMNEIMEIAQENDLKVVEDAAHSVNAKYRNKYLGTIGDFGCYSFHESKNYTCGEGGALLINTDEISLWERAEIIREKGTNRSKFFRGEVDKYLWVDIGSSYLPSDILAAFLYAQLETLDEIQKQRLKIWNAYYDGLRIFEDEGLLRLPVVPEYSNHNAHLFYVLFNSGSMRDQMMNGLGERGVHAVFHYLPLHLSPMGMRLGYKKGDFPITENVSERLLRLPVYAGMKDSEIEYVLESFRDVIRKNNFPG